MGDFRKTIEYHNKSLEIDIEIGNRSRELLSYGNLGLAYGSLGNPRKAIDYYENALEIAKEIDNRTVESSCYGNLGSAYYSLGDFGKSLEYCEKSIEIAVDIGDIDLERISTYNLALFYDDNLNKPKTAYDFCKKAIDLSEKISGGLVEEEHKIGFSSRISDSYEYIVPLCLKMKKKNEAFKFLEQGKSRAFLDLLAATKINPSVKLTPKLKSLLEEEEIHLAKLREIQTQHLRQKKLPTELGRVDKIVKKLDLVYKKIEKLDPEYVFIRGGKPLSFIELQHTLTEQKKDTVLIEYFITSYKVFIFIVSSREKKLYIEEVTISQERLNLYIENYLRAVARCQDLDDIKES